MGSKRSRFFRESKPKTLSYKRKQRVRFRSRYAGKMAQQWGKRVGQAASALVFIGLGIWGSISFMQFWQNSSILRVKNLIFTGDIPAALRATIPVHPNDNLFLLHPSKLEDDLSVRFQELKRFSIRRQLNGNVLVSGKFRIPVARTNQAGNEMGIDGDGVIFPLGEISNIDKSLLPWIECARIENRPNLLAALLIWKEKIPAFYSLVKKLETDKMPMLHVELVDGVLINWGPLENSNIVERAKKVLRLREIFSPTKAPAELVIVADDRIVMNANWAKISGTNN